MKNIDAPCGEVRFATLGRSICHLAQRPHSSGSVPRQSALREPRLRWRLAFMLLALLLPPIAHGACGTLSRLECERLSRLVEDRMHAITTSFGDLAPIMPQDIEVRFMRTGSNEYRRYDGQPAYDPRAHALFLPLALTRQSLPALRPATDEYWPFYTAADSQQDFVIVHKIDAALWNVYLQEAARRSGLSWPHPDCKSPDSARRLPCEMVVNGALEYVSRAQQRIFNANRIERVWPEDYAQFAARLWRKDDRNAMDVKRYGGLLLVQPLVRKFGVPRMLAYIAQTPFKVEHNNMRASALRYQEHALRDAM